MIGSLAVLGLMLGAKPLAVMIHGAGGGGWEYRYWKPVFERAGYHVVAPDLLPTGGRYEDTRFEHYVDQVVRAGKPGTAVLIGASMGGILALKAAERLKPKALVLVCSTSPALGQPPGKSDHPPVIRWKGGPYKDTVDSMPDSDEPTRRFAHPRWRDESGAVLNAIAAGIEVEKPACPVLVVIPEADESIPPARQQELATWCGADTLRFARMSHVGPLFSRRREEVARGIVDWLSARGAHAGKSDVGRPRA